MSPQPEESPFARALEAALKERAALEAAGELIVDTWQSEPASETPEQRRPVFASLRQRVGSAWSRVRSLCSVGRPGRSGRRLRVVETAVLGEKRFVAILAVEQREFLIGGGPAGIALLADLQAEPARDSCADRATMFALETRPGAVTGQVESAVPAGSGVQAVSRVQAATGVQAATEVQAATGVQAATVRADEALPVAPPAPSSPPAPDALARPDETAVHGSSQPRPAARASKSAALRAPKLAALRSPQPAALRASGTGAPAPEAGSARAPGGVAAPLAKPAVRQAAPRAAKPVPPATPPTKDRPAPRPASASVTSQAAKGATERGLPSAAALAATSTPKRRTSAALGAKRATQTAPLRELHLDGDDGVTAELALAPVARRRKAPVAVTSPEALPLREASPLFEATR